jgi:hypothetical protein
MSVVLDLLVCKLGDYSMPHLYENPKRFSVSPASVVVSSDKPSFQENQLYSFLSSELRGDHDGDEAT